MHYTRTEYASAVAVSLSIVSYDFSQAVTRITRSHRQRISFESLTVVTRTTQFLKTVNIFGSSNCALRNASLYTLTVFYQLNSLYAKRHTVQARRHAEPHANKYIQAMSVFPS